MPSMWTSKAMWKAVLLSLLLHTAGHIISHHTWHRAGNAFMAAVPSQPPQAASAESETSPEESFYLKTLPLELMCLLPLVVLSYRWQCWLERVLPTRPRGANPTAQEPEKFGSAVDELEEEITRRLIARGVVRRASISWCNVILKWLLDNTLANLVFGLTFEVLGALWSMQSLKLVYTNVGWTVLGLFVTHFFSVSPLVSFVNFALVPVQHRLPFQEAMDLAVTVFLAAFLNVFVPWLTSKEMMQDIFRNVTEQAWKTHNETVKKNSTLLLDAGSAMGELR